MSLKPTKKLNEAYKISEFGLIGTDKDVLDYNRFKSELVDHTVYKEIEEFAKTDYGRNVFTFSGNGRFLQAKSYVGTIQTKSGYLIEILPKIYNERKEDNSKEIFINLLRMLYKLPSYKHINKANLQSDKMPILEIFISMFLEEVGVIIKKGIKSDYIPKENNENFLKGKLYINEQIKRNYIHKERFYVGYDEYSPNRAENKLIKSTLKYLLNISSSFENIRRTRMYLEHMYGVDYSVNIDRDFRLANTKTRGMEHYSNALVWSRIFLKKESFSTYSGKTVAFAILYPMEKLFENYIEHLLINNEKNCQVIPQSGETVFVKKSSNNKLFGVRPDFILKQEDEIKVVADAKWKIINNDDNSFSQSDFYQLFAYSRIYFQDKEEFEPLRLYYPMNENFRNEKEFIYFDNKTKINAIPVDMNELVKKR
jgi:5-methylcytosine-specific restriction enzyme subunit McrC